MLYHEIWTANQSLPFFHLPNYWVKDENISSFFLLCSRTEAYNFAKSEFQLVK